MKMTNAGFVPFLLTCKGRAIVASGIQDEAGGWMFTGYCDGAATVISSEDVTEIRRVGLNGREYPFSGKVS